MKYENIHNCEYNASEIKEKIGQDRLELIISVKIVNQSIHFFLLLINTKSKIIFLISTSICLLSIYMYLKYLIFDVGSISQIK